jgi:hypothetical protein
MLLKRKSVLWRLIMMVLPAVFFFAPSGVTRASPRVVHVFVALADNQNQGIVPVPAALGNGSDPARNLYWGAAFGVKTFFKASQEWQPVWSGHGSKDAILERCVFRNTSKDVFLIADAYEGGQVKLAMTDFLSAAAGITKEKFRQRFVMRQFRSRPPEMPI